MMNPTKTGSKEEREREKSNASSPQSTMPPEKSLKRNLTHMKGFFPPSNSGKNIWKSTENP